MLIWSSSVVPTMCSFNEGKCAGPLNKPQFWSRHKLRFECQCFDSRNKCDSCCSICNLSYHTRGTSTRRLQRGRLSDLLLPRLDVAGISTRGLLDLLDDIAPRSRSRLRWLGFGGFGCWASAPSSVESISSLTLGVGLLDGWGCK